MSKTISKTIRANFHFSQTANGVQVGFPNENGKDEIYVFEKSSEDDTTYLDRAEIKMEEAYKLIRAEITETKKQTDAYFSELRNPQE